MRLLREISRHLRRKLVCGFSVFLSAVGSQDYILILLAIFYMPNLTSLVLFYSVFSASRWVFILVWPYYSLFVFCCFILEEANTLLLLLLSLQLLLLLFDREFIFLQIIIFFHHLRLFFLSLRLKFQEEDALDVEFLNDYSGYSLRCFYLNRLCHNTYIEHFYRFKAICSVTTRMIFEIFVF